MSIARIDIFTFIIYNNCVEKYYVGALYKRIRIIMDYASTLEKLKRINQEHLLEYYDELSDEEKNALLSDIERIDFSVLSCIESQAERKVGKLSPADLLAKESIERDRAEYERIGLKAIAQGKVAAVLLAGGQGTRLGYHGPKGMFDMGVTRKLPIFMCQMQSVLDVARRAGYNFHLFIMTSNVNDEKTREFFAENDYFGYDKEKIHFFIQDETTACTFDGKVILEKKHRPAFVPNGNGGWYASLLKSGLGGIIKEEGVEWLNVYGVDNVLQKICDPVFVGATIKHKVNCSSKVVCKERPEENVGVLCKEDGAPTVIEYTELDDEHRYARDGSGKLVYSAGVILNYLFSVNKLNEICGKSLPYHIARKKVEYLKGGKLVVPEEPNAYKFELLAVDLVKFMGNCLAFEVEREREFAPVKNAKGEDSVESARVLLVKNGVIL